MVKLKFDNVEDEFLNIIDVKLDELTDNVFANSQDIIVQKNIIDEGTLLKTGNINREFLEKTIIYPVPYADDIEFGVLPGNEPSLTAIKKWVKRKKIKTKQQDINRVAYLIVQNIKREGQEPRPFLSPAVEIEANKLRGK